MSRPISPSEAAHRAATARRILLAGCTAEPCAVLNAVAADPALWQGMHLTGAFIPGINDRDYSAIGQDTVVETIFTTAGLRAQKAVGTVDHLPIHYSTFAARLARPGLVDLVLMVVPPPAADGTVGFGLTSDFAPTAIAGGARLIGVVHPDMPDAPGAPRLPLSRFEAFTEADAPLVEMAPAPPDDINRAIAQHVVDRMPKGATLQLGLGKIQSAVLEAVRQSGRRDLGFHGGMISDGVVDAMDAGVFTRGVTTGVALGTLGFYNRLSDRSDILYRPVSETHAHHTLARCQAFVSVNSVMQVDLMGQANAEQINGRQVSGHGGMVDFVRGARASQGGVSILALPSRASVRHGSAGERMSVSRIVSTLAEGTPVSVARSDVDLVITEYGVADLREAGLGERAEKLIAIAAPEFRDALADDAQQAPS